MIACDGRRVSNSSSAKRPVPQPNSVTDRHVPRSRSPQGHSGRAPHRKFANRASFQTCRRNARLASVKGVALSLHRNPCPTIPRVPDAAPCGCRMANREGNRMTAVITGLARLMLKRSEAGKATCGGPHFAEGSQKSGKADDRSDADSSPFPNEPCRAGLRPSRWSVGASIDALLVGRSLAIVRRPFGRQDSATFTAICSSALRRFTTLSSVATSFRSGSKAVELIETAGATIDCRKSELWLSLLDGQFRASPSPGGLPSRRSDRPKGRKGLRKIFQRKYRVTH